MAKTKANKNNTVQLSSKTIKQLKNNKNPKPQKQKKPKAKKMAVMGPVSSITTAPVAIGNSVRGASKDIKRTPNGVRIRGRDFMFAPIGTGSITTWTLCGGTPLTPAAFADSVIANFQRMYMKFKFHSLAVHFITSSPTSANGDVMFYYSKDRSSVFLNQTSSQLLPFVFTDQSTVLGPQWTNHTAIFDVKGDWKLTDYGMHDGIEEYADGEMFLLSKTSTTDSPGYVIFDYDIEFAEESFQPRLLSFPLPKIQWFQTDIGVALLATTKDVTPVALQLRANNISGVGATLGTNYATGDIFKVIIDSTNSVYVNATASNLFDSNGAIQVSLPISDGFTCYAVYNGSSFQFYPNATSAYTSADAFNYGLTSASISIALQVWLSYIGTLNSTAMVPNF